MYHRAEGNQEEQEDQDQEQDHDQEKHLTLRPRDSGAFDGVGEAVLDDFARGHFQGVSGRHGVRPLGAETAAEVLVDPHPLDQGRAAVIAGAEAVRTTPAPAGGAKAADQALVHH